MTEQPYQARIAELGRATVTTLATFEHVQRRLHPPEIPTLRTLVEQQGAELARALSAFRGTQPPAGLEAFHAQLERAGAAADEAVLLFAAPAPPSESVARILGSLRSACRALEALYPLRQVLPPLAKIFAEPPLHDQLESLDPEATPAGVRANGVSVGMHTTGGAEDDPDARGGFVLYVPERYDGSAAWPLIVALHGGSGHGRDFVWTWLREARSRGCLLIAPTSQGSTWSLHEPDRDAAALRSMVEYVQQGWRVDPGRVLLTGLSDGATFTLLAGLAEDAPYTHLAPVSGVLHPWNFRNGNLERARGRRIHLVHGALDWMFPAEIARAAHEALAGAGADIVYRELPDLSHTYPREENARMLRWMDPGLTLPGEA